MDIAWAPRISLPTNEQHLENMIMKAVTGHMDLNKSPMDHIAHLRKFFFLHVFNIILQISYYLPL